MKVFGGIMLFLIVLVGSTIANGYVFSQLWSWFVVPTFALPVLSIPVAIGIAGIVRYLTHQINDLEEKKRTPSEQLFRSLSMTIFYPLFTYWFGAIVHHFM